MQVLGERLGEAVRERLRHDRAVVVVLGLEAGGERVEAESGGDREGAHVVADGSDVVGETAIRARVAVGGLLAEEAEARAVAQDEVHTLGLAALYSGQQLRVERRLQQRRRLRAAGKLGVHDLIAEGAEVARRVDSLEEVGIAEPAAIE